MHTPKVSPNPPPPAPAPSQQDSQVLAARQSELRRQRALYGRQGTILAGSSGTMSSGLSAPTLIGA